MSYLIIKCMKKFVFILVLFSSIGLCYAQTKYDKIEMFDVYRTDWAMVKVGNKLGFIDNKGREVVKPIYDKIEMFDVQKNDWAMVEIDGRVGFIDKEGKFIQE